jgi:cyanobactin maturation PatA/PatG family protease
MNLTSDSLIENALRINTIPGIPELWAETLGDKRVCIAVIDSNIDYEHSSFKGADIRTIGLFNSGNNGSNENYTLDHGTSLASIIFGQHHSLIKGLAPDCKGFIIPVFRSKEQDVTSCSQLDLARTIQTADQNGANIINISGGEFSASGKSEVILAETIQKCVNKGILIISAAGNDGCECLHIPAAENSVLAVGAMDENNQPLDFSNWGQAYKSNGLLFPGNNILTALPGNDTTLKTGTSFATAVASGIAGLLMSLLVKYGKKPDGKIVFDALINSAFKCKESDNNDCTKSLAGYVNVKSAVRKILAGCNFFE